MFFSDDDLAESLALGRYSDDDLAESSEQKQCDFNIRRLEVLIRYAEFRKFV